MKQRTEIDLTKMTETGRTIYLSHLLQDLAGAIHDLTSDRLRYDHFTHLMEHAEQASNDLNTLIERKKGKKLYIYDKTTQGTAGHFRTSIRGSEEYCLEKAQELYPNCLWAWEK